MSLLPRISLPLALALCLALLSQPLYAGYYEGYESYTRGDFEAALVEWKKVAEPEFSLFGSGIPKDADKRQEMADARYAIGLLYWNGKGVEQNYSQSATWMRDAAALGHAEAQLKLGYMYINARGVPRDTAKAEEWLLKAAEQGNMDAQYNLAVLYYKGMGEGEDLAKARHWFEQAAAQGDEVSARVLKDLSGSQVAALPVPQAAPQPDLSTQPLRLSTPSQRPSPQVSTAPSQPATTAATSLHPPGWLAANPDSRYSIQLIAASQLAGLERLTRQHPNLQPFAYYTKQKGNSLLYILVQGIYSTQDEARAVLTALPEGLKKNRPFITSIGGIRPFLSQR